MKVKITKCSKTPWWYNDRIGEIFDVTQDCKGDYEVTENEYRKLLETEETEGVIGYHIKFEDCEVIAETQWLTKEAALKLAIDGAKVVNERSSHPMTYVDFDGINFVYHNGCSGNKQDISLVIGRWYLWTPPSPKFTNGTFVVDECGDYMRVIESEFVNGKHMYYLATGKGCTKDDCVSLWESELTEV